MQIQKQYRRNRQAFTLIEMIGVLAVIAILGSLLIPKVFEAINNSKINNALLSYNTIKAATTEHYGKKGAFTDAAGVALAAADAAFDKNVLLPQALIDKPFLVKIGSEVNQAVKIDAPADAGDPVDANSNLAWDLEGSTGTNTVTGQWVVYAEIQNVAVKDAIELSERLDGPTLSTNSISDADLQGRVIYQAPATPGGASPLLRMYIAHR